MAKLHSFGPELLATFQNGYVTEFLPGAALEPDDLLQPFYTQRIAATFRKWHSLTVDSALQRQLKGMYPAVEMRRTSLTHLASHQLGHDRRMGWNRSVAAKMQSSYRPWRKWGC